MNLASSASGSFIRPARQSALASSMRSFDEETKFHSPWPHEASLNCCQIWLDPRAVARSPGKLLPSALPAQDHVRSPFAGHGLRAFVSKSAQVQAVEQVLPRAEQHRGHHEMQLIDQARAQVLAHG